MHAPRYGELALNGHVKGVVWYIKHKGHQESAEVYEGMRMSKKEKSRCLEVLVPETLRAIRACG